MKDIPVEQYDPNTSLRNVKEKHSGVLSMPGCQTNSVETLKGTYHKCLIYGNGQLSNVY